MRSIRTYLKLALLCTVLSGFVGCSNNDDIVPENKNEKLAGPKPAKVVINVIEGHLHGYAAFHENKNVRWCEIHGRSTRVCLHTARRQMGARP